MSSDSSCFIMMGRDFRRPWFLDITCFINLERAQAFLVVFSLSFCPVQILYTASAWLGGKPAQLSYVSLYVYVQLCRVQICAVHIFGGEEAEVVCHCSIHITIAIMLLYNQIQGFNDIMQCILMTLGEAKMRLIVDSN